MAPTADPASKIGLDGWLAVLVVIGISITKIGPSMKNTLWYKYRTVTGLWEYGPQFIGFLAGSATVLISVAWYYFLTVTSNNGWVNELFLHQVYSYDVLLALILVYIILIKSYSWFFCMMDYWHFRYTAAPDYSKKDLAVEALNPVPSNTTLRNRLETQVRYQTAVSGANDIATFQKNMVTYNFNNNWVRWGTFVYLAAVAGFGVTVLGFLATKYNYAPADHSYVVIFWTWTVGFILIVAAWVFNMYAVFSTNTSDSAKIQALTSGVTQDVVDYRNLEASVY